jgi:hypothetical protein
MPPSQHLLIFLTTTGLMGLLLACKYGARGLLWAFLGSALVYGLLLFADAREYSRASKVIRRTLAERRCRRCDGPFEDWDGVIHSGDFHFYDGGYWPRIVIRCARCQTEYSGYVSGDHSVWIRDWSESEVKVVNLDSPEPTDPSDAPPQPGA